MPLPRSLEESEPPPDYSDSESTIGSSLPSTPTRPYTISSNNADLNWTLVARPPPPSYADVQKQWPNYQPRSWSQNGSSALIPETHQQNKEFQQLAVHQPVQNNPVPEQVVEIPQGDCPNCGIGVLKSAECTGSMIMFNLFCGIFGILLAPFGVCMICMECPADYQCPHCKATFNEKGC